MFGRIAGKRGRIRQALTDQILLDVSPKSIHMTTVGPVVMKQSEKDGAWLMFLTNRPTEMRVISRALYRIALGALAVSDAPRAFDPALDDVRAYIKKPPHGYGAHPFLEADLLRGVSLQETPALVNSTPCEVGFREKDGALLCLLDFVTVAFIVPLAWRSPNLPPFRDVRLRIAWEDGTTLDNWTVQPQS